MLAFVFTAGCTGASQKGDTTAETAPERPDSTGQTAPAMSEGTMPTTAPTRESPDYGFTYGPASGNRVVEGSGRLPDSEPLDVELGGRPVWVAGIALGEETAWVVALEDGRVETLRLDGEAGAVEPTRIVPGGLPAGAPPAVRAWDERVELLMEPDDRGSHLTHPVPFGNGRLGVTEDGRLLVDPGEDPQIQALPDARPVRSADGRVAVLSNPTER